LQSDENPVVNTKHEKNATSPGLANKESLKLLPVRVSHLCLRSAYLHRGNALAALGREDEATETYMKVFPMLEKEPRCGRLDWERCSLYVNIGNTFSRQGNFEKADEQFSIAESLGREHIENPEGNKIDGMGMVVVAMRARAFALKKAGKEEEGKKVLKDVIEMQIKLNAESEEKTAEDAAKLLAEGAEGAPETAAGQAIAAA
jgi:tetratricopeptide (TPR) repeat protein